MSSCRDRLQALIGVAGAALLLAQVAGAQGPPAPRLVQSAAAPAAAAKGQPTGAAPAAVYAGIGRAATPRELRAWDIDVRPDFKGLPAGSGSAARGMEVWEAKCASCHGVFGESNEVFAPLIGGTTADDIRTGRVARLHDNAYPGRTTMMKLSSVSTLWDYINRAMPWTQPKSLSTEEVYAVTAYILHLGGVVPGDFVLSDRNIAQVQQRLPNRNGMTTDHALWPGAGLGRHRPDVAAPACMSGCATEPTVASFLPDHARNAHGNLAEQNRLVGPQRGADTTLPAGSGARPAAPAAAPAASTSGGRPAAGMPPAEKKAAVDAGAALALARQHNCTACHGLDSKIVGPGFRDIARRHGGRADAVAYLAGKAKNGGGGVWGAIAMPPQQLGEADAQVIARWLAVGAPR